jgi:hypothetical protein
MTKLQTPKYATGDKRRRLEKLIPVLELQSETERSRNNLVTAEKLMQETMFLRRLLPPTSHVHDRPWNHGDMFPVDVAFPAP